MNAATGAVAPVAGATRIQGSRTLFIDRLRVVLTALVVATFAGLWFVLPLASRRRRQR